MARGPPPTIASRVVRRPARHLQQQVGQPFAVVAEGRRVSADDVTLPVGRDTAAAVADPPLLDALGDADPLA